MNPPDRKPSAKERRVYLEVEIQGHAISEVATRYQLQSRTIRRMIRRVRTNQQSRPKKLEPSSATWLHLQRLENEWSEAMRAWYRSQKEQRIVKLSQSGDQAAEQRPDRLEQTRKSTSGDVRFLAEARRALHEIRELRRQLESQSFELPEQADEPFTAELDARRTELRLLLEQQGESETDRTGNPPD